MTVFVGSITLIATGLVFLYFLYREAKIRNPYLGHSKEAYLVRKQVEQRWKKIRSYDTLPDNALEVEIRGMDEKDFFEFVIKLYKENPKAWYYKEQELIREMAKQKQAELQQIKKLQFERNIFLKNQEDELKRIWKRQAISLRTNEGDKVTYSPTLQHIQGSDK